MCAEQVCGGGDGGGSVLSSGTEVPGAMGEKLLVLILLFSMHKLA